jgi:hypothetical protein
VLSKTEILPKVGTGRGVRGPKKIKNRNRNMQRFEDAQLRE